MSAIVLLSLTAVLEFNSILPHYAITGLLHTPLYQNDLYVITTRVFFGGTGLIAAYLATSIQERLRQHEAGIIDLSESLQKAANRLQALNDSARNISSTLDLQRVLDRLVQTTSEVMGVRACSIRLLTKSGERLDTVAVYGLSQTYLEKGRIEVGNNPGLVFYAAAAICFALAWRTARREQNAVWPAVLDLWRGAWREIRETVREAVTALRRALPYPALRSVVIIAVVLNSVAAIAALLLPALMGVWGVAWATTIIAAIAYLWPRSVFRRLTVAAAPPPARTYTEPALASDARLNPIALLISIGLLLLGQVLLMSDGQAPSGGSPLAQVLDDAFQLRLPGDGALVWPGVIAVVTGAVMFAGLTRRAALKDYPPLSLTEASSSPQRGLWLVLVALCLQ